MIVTPQTQKSFGGKRFNRRFILAPREILHLPADSDRRDIWHKTALHSERNRTILQSVCLTKREEIRQ
jgi:hypothetical protein